jgi:hypothetical protein
MANSIQYEKTQSTPSVKLNTNELAGRVRVAFAEYEASAEQSTVTMFTIPNNSRLLSATVSHDALGSSTTLSVGNAAYTDADGTAVGLDVDAYKAAAASTTATSSDALVTMALGKNAVVDANEDGLPVTVTLAGDDCTGTIQLQMFYVLD